MLKGGVGAGCGCGVAETRRHHKVVVGGLPRLFPFCAAQQVLDEFRDQFIQGMDSNAVVLDLLHHNIITEGDQRTITMTMDRTQQNKFLHLYLRKCTKDAFHLVCDIISDVKGNLKMSALGTAMKWSLQKGNCVRVCMYACMCVSVYTFVNRHTELLFVSVLKLVCGVVVW